MYEIFMTHNRPWTTREVLFFVILFFIATTVFMQLFKKKKIVLSQVFAGELLFVFTMNGMHKYELIPFWSWLEAASGNLEYLKEIVLNMILFFPAGLLLPFVFHIRLCLVYFLFCATVLSSYNITF